MRAVYRGALSPLILLCLALLAFTGVAPAGADDDAADADLVGSRPMETVQVTATRQEQSIYDVSEAVTVVDARRIREIAPQVISEVLRNEPGAFFQQTTPGQGIPIVRGLKGSQVLHLVDGMRLNNGFFRDAPNQYIGLVDPFNTDRVELVRGTAPTLYGADAMGGVVQFLSPETRFEGPEWQGEGRLYASWSSADDSLVGRAEAVAGNDRRSLSGGVTWRDHGHRKTGGGETIRPTAYDAQGGDFKWLEALGSGELMFSAQYMEQPSTPRIDELVPGFGQTEPSAQQYEFEPNSRSFMHARYRSDVEASWLSRIEVNIARQVIDDDRTIQDFGSNEVDTEKNRSTLDGVTLQLFTDLAFGGGEGGLTWGAEYYTDTIDSSRTVTDIRSGQAVDVRGRFPDGSTMDSAAIYASLGWRRDALSLHGGLRYSRFDISLPAAGQSPAADLSPDDLTGDLHLEWSLTDRLNFVANVGRGFRPPNIFDLGTLGPRPGNRFNIPNPDLGPETLWGYDVGFKTRGEVWQAEIYFFYSDYQDKIGSRETGEVTENGRIVVQSDNINSAGLYGIESGIRGYLWAGFEVYGVINAMRGEETDPDGQTVAGDRIPPLNGRLGLVWNPREDLRLEPFVVFAGNQDRLSPRDVGDPRINPRGTAGWGTLNLLASWQATEQLEVGFRLENIGDNDYRDHGSGIDAPGLNVGLWLSLQL